MKNLIANFNSPILTAMFETHNMNDLTTAMDTVVDHVAANPTLKNVNRLNLLFQAHDTLEEMTRIVKENPEVSIDTDLVISVMEDIATAETFILTS